MRGQLDLDCPQFSADPQDEIDLSAGSGPQVPRLMIAANLRERRQDLVDDVPLPACSRCRQRGQVVVGAETEQGVQQPERSSTRSD